MQRYFRSIRQDGFRSYAGEVTSFKDLFLVFVLFMAFSGISERYRLRVNTGVLMGFSPYIV
jgi:hypothetical protein